jgi:hypothetical protein
LIFSEIMMSTFSWVIQWAYAPSSWSFSDD